MNRAERASRLAEDVPPASLQKEKNRENLMEVFRNSKPEKKLI